MQVFAGSSVASAEPIEFVGERCATGVHSFQKTGKGLTHLKLAGAI
jgi:hypothetical protein